MFKTIGKAFATVALAAGLTAALGSPALAITASDCLRADKFITEVDGVAMCHGAGQKAIDGEVISG